PHTASKISIAVVGSITRRRTDARRASYRPSVCVIGSPPRNGMQRHHWWRRVFLQMPLDRRGVVEADAGHGLLSRGRRRCAQASLGPPTHNASMRGRLYDDLGLSGEVSLPDLDLYVGVGPEVAQPVAARTHATDNVRHVVVDDVIQRGGAQAAR